MPVTRTAAPLHDFSGRSMLDDNGLTDTMQWFASAAAPQSTVQPMAVDA